MAGEDTRLPMLERNEVIALINLLERLSHSIEIVRDMYQQLAAAGSTADSSSSISSDSTSSISAATPGFLENLPKHLHDSL